MPAPADSSSTSTYEAHHPGKAHNESLSMSSQASAQPEQSVPVPQHAFETQFQVNLTSPYRDTLSTIPISGNAYQMQLMVLEEQNKNRLRAARTQKDQEVRVVDIETKCGVIMKDGLPCTKPLACKRHSMKAKRAVPGRSMPFDKLLEAYQESQAKQQEAASQPNSLLWK